MGVALAQPRGEFNEYVGVGVGLMGFVRGHLDERGVLGLRLQGGVLTYGRETQRVPLSETIGRIEVDLTTSNNIFLLSAGPELAIPMGNARVWAHAGGGLGYFSTDSQVQGSLGDQEPFASTRNFSDAGFAWNAGAGIDYTLARIRGSPVALTFGLSHQENGRREYLTRGGIRDLPGGGLEFDVKRSQANFLLWTFGVSVGFVPE